MATNSFLTVNSLEAIIPSYSEQQILGSWNTPGVSVTPFRAAGFTTVMATVIGANSVNLTYSFQGTNSLTPLASWLGSAGSVTNPWFYLPVAARATPTTIIDTNSAQTLNTDGVTTFVVVSPSLLPSLSYVNFRVRTYAAGDVTVIFSGAK